MAEIYFISDTHLNHDNILKFTDESGKLIRPGFKNVSEMNHTIISNWNKVVTPQDKIYHLGDVIFGPCQDHKKLLGSLNGKKRLILGNHDDPSVLAPYFQKIMLWQIFKEFGFLCSHLPLLPETFRKVTHNVHGHIHEKPSPSPQHINISVERINYTPVHLEKIRKMIQNA